MPSRKPKTGRLPKKPTSGSWAGDAKALLDMGATSIDAGTVRGLLEESERTLANVRRLLDRLYLLSDNEAHLAERDKGTNRWGMAALYLFIAYDLEKAIGGTLSKKRMADLDHYVSQVPGFKRTKAKARKR